jgi:hypothetical protein
MVSSHVPDSIALLGMVCGVIFAPIAVLGILFLIAKAAFGV